ncbi:MAG: hypothetical protein AAF490_13255 [Chloroflexota bacterium]
MFSIVGCASPSDDRVLPTLVPTLDTSRPTLPPVAEGDLRPYPVVTYENQLLGISFSHPENWAVRQTSDDQIRLVPDPSTVNEFATFISPSIVIQNLSVENGQLDENVDIEDATAVLEFLIDAFQSDFETLMPISEASTTNHDGVAIQLEQDPPPFISEDVNPDEIELSQVTNEITVLLNGDQLISVTNSATTEDFETLQTIFDDLKNSIELTGVPENPTE